MKVFQQREIHLAYAYSAGGGQALHLMDGAFAHMQARTPNCFKNRRQIAHLFDMDTERLAKTARRLGVRKILIEHPGYYRQHVDLCGKPLERALAQAKAESTPRLM